MQSVMGCVDTAQAAELMQEVSAVTATQSAATMESGAAGAHNPAPAQQLEDARAQQVLFMLVYIVVEAIRSPRILLHYQSPLLVVLLIMLLCYAA